MLCEGTATIRLQNPRARPPSSPLGLGWSLNRVMSMGVMGRPCCPSSTHWYLKTDICPIPEASLGQKAASGCCQAAVSCGNSSVFSGSLLYLPLASKLPVVPCGKRAGRQNPRWDSGVRAVPPPARESFGGRAASSVFPLCCQSTRHLADHQARK